MPVECLLVVGIGYNEAYRKLNHFVATLKHKQSFIVYSVHDCAKSACVSG